MARNEEKQQGKLNRLWLQKEREEGRLKDRRETRPKLYTLNTAAAVKKWIPSIKNEIEYYLQQSQLTHYPERKITEFQFKIESLEKEYKSFITKLRVLDPSCKHHPWTPRAYCKRRADQQDSPTPAKKPNATLTEGSRKLIEDNTGEPGISTPLLTGTAETFIRPSESRTANEDCRNINTIDTGQDLPLSFDQSRLAVAVAPYRGSSSASGLTNNLARVLQSGLPNLGNSMMSLSNYQNFTDKNQRQTGDSTNSLKSNVCTNPVFQEEPQCDSEKRASGKALSFICSERQNVLGLDCYSSSDDDES